VSTEKDEAKTRVLDLAPPVLIPGSRRTRAVRGPGSAGHRAHEAAKQVVAGERLPGRAGIRQGFSATLGEIRNDATHPKARRQGLSLWPTIVEEKTLRDAVGGRTALFRAAVVAGVTFAAMLAFEAAKEALVPDAFSRWQSHWVTIAFATLVGCLASLVAFRVYEHEARARRQAQAEREALVRKLESALREREDLASSLRESEHRYRTFQALSSEGIARLDLDEPLAVARPEEEQIDHILRTARLAECNEAFERMLRRPVGERLVGLGLSELAAVSELREGLGGFVRGGYRLVGSEAPRLRPDGVTVWASASAIGIVEDGYLRAIWITQQDVTGRKQAEEDLRTRDRILEAVAFCSARFLQAGRWEDSVPEALARLGEAVSSSRAYILKNHQAPDGELQATLWREWVAPGVAPYAHEGIPWRRAGLARWEALLSEGQAVVGVVRELPESNLPFLKDSDDRSVLLVPFFVEGRWWGCLGFAQSRHERRWSPTEVETLRTAALILGASLDRQSGERALRDSEERFSRLAAASFEGIAITEEGVFVDGNDQLATMLGSDLSKLIGRSPLEFVAPEHRALVTSRLRNRSDEPYSHLARRMDGTIFPVEIRAKPIPYKGRTARVTALREITERVAAEQALRASEKKYRDIVDFSPIGVSQARPDGTVITANLAFARLLGYETAEEVLGLNLARDVYFDPEDRVRLIDRYEGVGQVSHVEVLLKRRDGSPFWAEISAHAVKDTAGVSLYFESFVQDISARRSVEAALGASEERYRLLFEGNPLPMLVSDLETLRFLAVNEAAVRQYGYAREELLGLSVPDLAVPEDPELERFRTTRYDTRPDLVHLGLRQQRRKDGTPIDIDLTSLVITFGGRAARLALARDVTAERQANAEREKLRAALERAGTEWQRSVDAVDTAVLVLDREGRIARLNRAARELLGRDYQEVLRRRIDDVGREEPWRSAAEVVRMSRRTGSRESAQAQDANGARTWDLSAYRSAGGAVEEERTILTLRDITSFVALQEKLRRSETMAAMGSLVAGVAHEVRNPLFSISATLDTFDAEFGTGQEHTEFSTLLRSQVTRLTQLMRDLLDYGKPPALRVSAARPQDVIHRGLRSCAPLARERGVRVAEEAAPDLPVLSLDVGRMEQVFENLILNAIQHSPAGGTVRTAARLGGAVPNVSVVCTVEDEGPGFPEADIPRIFQPFFSRRRGGTGLGLSIVQRIVEAHGGSIVASNRAGGGAMFAVTLPTTGQEPRG
jgi:PAS domain S-box-containing protein